MRPPACRPAVADGRGKGGEQSRKGLSMSKAATAAAGVGGTVPTLSRRFEALALGTTTAAVTGERGRW